MPLSVPIPTLSQQEVSGTQFGAEKPIDLVCGAVTFPDGSVLTPANATAFGFLLYREMAAGVTQVWDEKEKKWLPASSALPEPQSLFPNEGKWQSILVAVGQKDKAMNQEKFGTDEGSHFPKYFVRCFFRGKDALGAEQSGASLPSQPVEVFGLGKRNRAGLSITPEPATAANQIGLFLKDTGLNIRGEIRILGDGGGFRIELLANDAQVILRNNGEIYLRPRSGQVVRVDGVLAVDGQILVNGTQLLVP